MSETKTVMMPSELTRDEANLIRGKAFRAMIQAIHDSSILYNLSPDAIQEIYKAAVELLGE